MHVHSVNCLKENVDHCPSVFTVYVEVQPLVCQLVCQTVVKDEGATDMLRRSKKI